MIAVLSWHVQNYVVMPLPWTELQPQSINISTEFELGWTIHKCNKLHGSFLAFQKPLKYCYWKGLLEPNPFIYNKYGYLHLAIHQYW